MSNFADIFGQEYAVTVLKNMLKQKKVHHSLIFQGGEAVGKFYTSFLFSKTFFCLARDEEKILACNKCRNCQNHHSFPNALFLTSSDRIPQIAFYQKRLQESTPTDQKAIFELLLLEINHLLNRHNNQFLNLLKTKKQSYPEGVVMSENSLTHLIHKIHLKISQASQSISYFGTAKFLEEMKMLQNSLDRTFIAGENFDKILKWCHKKNAQNKLVVIEDLAKMNLTVMSKFLKILEDPPERVYFVLITEKLEGNISVFEPLKSRSLVIHFFNLRGYLSEIAKKNFKIKDWKPFNESAENVKEFLQSYEMNDKQEQDFLLILNPKFNLKFKINHLEKRSYDLFAFINLVRVGMENFLANPQEFKKQNVFFNLNKVAKISRTLNYSSSLAKKHQVIEKNLMMKILLLFS